MMLHLQLSAFISCCFLLTFLDCITCLSNPFLRLLFVAVNDYVFLFGAVVSCQCNLLFFLAVLVVR
jgi:hypothetical protein